MKGEWNFSVITALVMLTTLAAELGWEPAGCSRLLRRRKSAAMWDTPVLLPT